MSWRRGVSWCRGLSQCMAQQDMFRILECHAGAHRKGLLLSWCLLLPQSLTARLGRRSTGAMAGAVLAPLAHTDPPTPTTRRVSSALSASPQQLWAASPSQNAGVSGHFSMQCCRGCHPPESVWSQLPVKLLMCCVTVMCTQQPCRLADYSAVGVCFVRSAHLLARAAARHGPVCVQELHRQQHLYRRCSGQRALPAALH